MARTKGTSQKKEKITEQMVTEMTRLRRQGYSISAIAKAVGCHRQTVSTYLKEKHEDGVGDDARRQVLAQALTSHFEQLARFAQVDLKLRLDASVPEYEKRRREPRPMGPISTNGTLGYPSTGRTGYMALEWARMYSPSPRESYLLRALREHTRDSSVWVYWDSWRNKVADYQKASRAVWIWLEEWLEDEPPEGTGPGEIEPWRDGLFGNILLAASGQETAEPDEMLKEAGEGEGVMPAAHSREAILSQYIIKVIREVKKRPEWGELESAMRQLKSRESQVELKRIARELDDALVSVELMHAFPGHCALCPA